MASTLYKLRGDGIPLNIADGGTNSGAALNNNRHMQSVGGAIVEAAALTDGQLFIGSTGAAPVAASLTAGTNITLTPGAGSLTISSTSGGVGGSGAAGQVAFWSAATTLSGDNGLWWDDVNKRVGIGTILPDYNLEVRGNTTDDVFGNYPAGVVRNEAIESLATIDALSFAAGAFTVDAFVSACGRTDQAITGNLAGGAIGTRSGHPLFIAAGGQDVAVFSTTKRFGVALDDTVLPTYKIQAQLEASEDGLVLQGGIIGMVGFESNDGATRYWTAGAYYNSFSQFVIAEGPISSATAFPFTATYDGANGKIGLYQLQPQYVVHLQRDTTSLTDGVYPSFMSENGTSEGIAGFQVRARDSLGSAVEGVLWAVGSDAVTQTGLEPGVVLGSASGYPLYFAMGPSDIAVFDTSGNFGIGLADGVFPSARTHIIQPAVAPVLYLEQTQSSEFIRLQGTAAVGDLNQPIVAAGIVTTATTSGS